MYLNNLFQTTKVDEIIVYSKRMERIILFDKEKYIIILKFIKKFCRMQYFPHFCIHYKFKYLQW
jgi:hypothetical protein